MAGLSASRKYAPSNQQSINPFDMDIVIIGLLLGGTYALMAMGLQLQYGVARIMNLANGEILIAGAFSALSGFTPARTRARCSRCSWWRPRPSS